MYLIQKFLTSKQYLAIPLERLSVTAFIGDKDCPKDIEAASTWENLGLTKSRIHFLQKERMQSFFLNKTFLHHSLLLFYSIH